MEEKLKGLNVYLAKEEEKLRMTCLYLWRVSLGFQIKWTVRMFNDLRDFSET